MLRTHTALLRLSIAMYRSAQEVGRIGRRMTWSGQLGNRRNEGLQGKGIERHVTLNNLLLARPSRKIDGPGGSVRCKRIAVAEMTSTSRDSVSGEKRRLPERFRKRSPRCNDGGLEAGKERDVGNLGARYNNGIALVDTLYAHPARCVRESLRRLAHACH